MPFRSPPRATALARPVWLLLILTLVFAAPAAIAAPAWVKGELRLNLRSGAGTQYKIIGSVETGDELNVLANRESWTRVRTKEGKVGWIPAGYLLEEPPAALRLETAEAEAAELRSQLEQLRADTAEMRETNARLTANDSSQREEIETLKLENLELRAGSRYLEWITGALILIVGMLVGAYLHRRNSTRRGGSRIRL